MSTKTATYVKDLFNKKVEHFKTQYSSFMALIIQLDSDYFSNKTIVDDFAAIGISNIKKHSIYKHFQDYIDSHNKKDFDRLVYV